MEYALVLNAPFLDTEIDENLIIAADGGYRLIDNHLVQAVIGDFDTLGYIPDNVLTITHPADKDKTDGELALDYIKSQGGTCVTVYGASGGHTDHVLGNVNLLAYANEIGLKAKIKNKKEEIFFIDGVFKTTLKKESVVSLLPFGGSVSFLTSKGLYYALDNLTIAPFSSRGISNKAIASEIEIEIQRGQALLIIRNN